MGMTVACRHSLGTDQVDINDVKIRESGSASPGMSCLYKLGGKPSSPGDFLTCIFFITEAILIGVKSIVSMLASSGMTRSIVGLLPSSSAQIDAEEIIQEVGTLSIACDYVAVSVMQSSNSLFVGQLSVDELVEIANVITVNYPLFALQFVFEDKSLVSVGGCLIGSARRRVIGICLKLAPAAMLACYCSFYTRGVPNFSLRDLTNESSWNV
jgi:hypothetical protein